MKIKMILALFTLGVTVVSAQKLNEAEVPSRVKESFRKKYPNTKAKWEKEGLDYEAEFEKNKVETSAVFIANGILKETEQEIKMAELPAGVKEYCAENFADYDVEEAAKITDASGIIMYEVELKKGKEKFDSIFDEKGNFVKKSGL